MTDKLTFNFWRNSACVVAALCAFASCMKETVYDNPLALSAVRNELSAEGGSTPVLVFANEPWTAYLPSSCGWASLEKTEGTGLGEFIFNFEENTGVARKTLVTVTTGGHTSYIEMVQKSGAGDAVIKFPYSSVSVAAVSGQATIPFESNIPQSETAGITASAVSSSGGEVSWIGDLTVYPDRVTFRLDGNAGGQKRSAVISLRYEDASGTQTMKNVTLTQTADPASLQFDPSVTGVMFNSMGTVVKLPFSTNLSLFVPQLVQNAVSSKDWARIEVTDATSPEIVVNIDPNPGSARVCRIGTHYTDADGGTIYFEYLLVQKAYVKPVTFGEVKAAIAGPSGECVYNEEGLLEAVVISDCGNANIETNPNITVNNIDYSMNWRTVYLSSPDGSSGIRAVFDNQADNTLKRGDVIFLDMAGLTLKKEENPARYTLGGLKSSSFSLSGSKADITPREKTISELIDDDLYTAVTLKGLEFAFKHGAYTNCHDGYQRQLKMPAYTNSAGEHINIAGSGVGYYFSDCTPCCLFDRDGNNVYALINNETPWRRYGNGVPQGECDITCIVTHTDLERWAYKGYLGRYQVRILEEEDIRQTGEAFSNVAVEWNWGENAGLLSREEAVKPTSPSSAAFYSITSNLDGVAKAEFNSGTLGNVCDYNNVINNNSADAANHKGYVKDGCIHWYRNGYFWASDNPDDMQAAPWFCFAFSTEGMSGSSMVFNWSAAQGLGWGSGSDRYAPVMWKVEYSADGANFTATDAIYAIHPIVQYNTNCASFAINGLHMYSTALPASLLGHKQVFVRIRAAGNNAIVSDGSSAYDGKIAKGSNIIRFGEAAVLYN